MMTLAVLVLVSLLAGASAQLGCAPLGSSCVHRGMNGGYPGGSYPGYPGGGYPGYPGGSYPGYPGGSYPGYPGGARPCCGVMVCSVTGGGMYGYCRNIVGK